MRLTRSLAIVFILAVAATLAADAGLTLTDRIKAHFPGADAIGFYIVFALASTFALVYGAKWLGKLLVRPEGEDEGREQADE